MKTSSEAKTKRPITIFRKENYILFFTGLAFIFIGFVLMTGGGSEDPAVFNEEIFSTTRITVAPLLVLLGFTIEFFAIMKKPTE
ncbi:MAG: hypothetical protein COC01_06890 [Bacteroidetes bacterium]|nr:MAG: hypothetical protein COC01_06890 [Bacteroidota bacterium]